MLHAQDRRPTGGQLTEQGSDVGRSRRIELRRRLVEDEDVGAHRDDARDRDPLLLATGQGERLAVGEVPDAEAREHAIDPVVHLLARHAQVLEAEGELLADRRLGSRQLIGRRREHDPHAAQELRHRRRAGRHRCRRW